MKWEKTLGWTFAIVSIAGLILVGVQFGNLPMGGLRTLYGGIVGFFALIFFYGLWLLNAGTDGGIVRGTKLALCGLKDFVGGNSTIPPNRQERRSGRKDTEIRRG